MNPTTSPMQSRSTPPALPSAALEAIKVRQQAMWASGDYSVIGTTLQIVGETLCEAADLRSGSRVLDVAAGTGNAALAAARRYCEVVALDYVPALLSHAETRARAEQVSMEVREGDAENLPFPEASFDAVLSVFGVMFAPNQERAAEELLRVCRRGGVIALASWTPDGFIGDLFRVVARHVTPPAGLRPPTAWGDPARARELFGAAASEIKTHVRDYVFRYRSAAHFVEVFRNWYGPTHKAFAALDREGQRALARDLLELLDVRNVADDGTLVVPAAYLELVVRKA